MQIFIGYSHQDCDYVPLLAAELERQGTVAQIDERIDYGTAWPAAIKEHMRWGTAASGRSR